MKVTIEIPKKEARMLVEVWGTAYLCDSDLVADRNAIRTARAIKRMEKEREK